jgi:hypothetical protein
LVQDEEVVVEEVEVDQEVVLVEVEAEVEVDLDEVEVLEKEKALVHEIKIVLIENLMIQEDLIKKVVDTLLKEMKEDDKDQLLEQLLQEEIVEIVIVLDEDNYF